MKNREGKEIAHILRSYFLKALKISQSKKTLKWVYKIKLNESSECQQGVLGGKRIQSREWFRLSMFTSKQL